LSSFSSSTTLTLYGGAGEIGGNKILLEDKGTRIFFDFGKSFARRSEFYDGFSKPRLVNGIGDLLELGIVPTLSGLYRQDLLSLCGRNAPEDRFADAVVLSHAHSDHADHISLLREDIPVWMGKITRTILESIEDSRNSDIEFEITQFKKRPIVKRDPPTRRSIQLFRTGDRFKIDSVEIIPVHVDHSIPGCYGFIIRTSENTIVYSGDLRLHGNKSELTRDFVKQAAEEKPDVMLCEGTRINEPVGASESGVFEACKFLLTQARGCFAFADYSYKDVDRFTTFYNVARETNRKLLIGIKAARYLSSLREADPSMNIPPIDDDSIGIYRPREAHCTEDDGDFYRSHTNVWTCEDVKQKESQVITSMSSYSADELIDIQPKSGLYLHSTSEPFDEEGMIDEERTRHWLEKYGLRKVHCHCSGHASGMELLTIVNEINPKTVVPIHTEVPELYPIFFGGRVRIIKESTRTSL
jgi:ribonuclease J